jgi:hypothetical protein
LLVQHCGNQKLKEIVAREPMVSPVFLVCEGASSEGGSCHFVEKYGQQLAATQRREEHPRQSSIGENGMMAFENRNLSLLTSSINYATSFREFSEERKEIMEVFNNSIMLEEGRQKGNLEEEGMVAYLLSKLRIIKPTPRNLYRTFEAIKSIRTREEAMKCIHQRKKEPNPEFAAHLEAIYLKYAIMN